MSLNNCAFIGNLGADPELKYLQDGTAVVNISIGCTERWKDKNTGEQKEKTEWIRANSFGKQAEIIAQYFHKGSQIYISGQMQTRKYQAQDGSDRYSTDIRIREFQFLDKKTDGQQGGQQPIQQNTQQPVQQQNKPVQPQSSRPYQGQNQPIPPNNDDFNDIIPF